MIVEIDDANPRVHLRKYRISVLGRYTHIVGLDENGGPLGGFRFRIPTDQIEVFTYALRSVAAGSLGQLALNAEYGVSTTVVTTKESAVAMTRLQAIARLRRIELRVDEAKAAFEVAASGNVNAWTCAAADTQMELSAVADTIARLAYQLEQVPNLKE